MRAAHVADLATRLGRDHGRLRRPTAAGRGVTAARARCGSPAARRLSARAVVSRPDSHGRRRQREAPSSAAASSRVAASGAARRRAARPRRAAGSSPATASAAEPGAADVVRSRHRRRRRGSPRSRWTQRLGDQRLPGDAVQVTACAPLLPRTRSACSVARRRSPEEGLDQGQLTQAARPGRRTASWPRRRWSGRGRPRAAVPPRRDTGRAVPRGPEAAAGAWREVTRRAGQADVASTGSVGEDQLGKAEGAVAEELDHGPARVRSARHARSSGPGPGRTGRVEGRVSVISGARAQGHGSPLRVVGGCTSIHHPRG